MVTLIVPCYNGAPYLNRCIDSILGQTCKDIELILINDGSTDSSERIIKAREKEIVEKLASFVYVSQENKGVGSACSSGFQKATGEYLMLLDVDDTLLKTSIESCVSFLNHNPEYALVRTNGYYVFEGNAEQPARIREPFHQGAIIQTTDVFEGLLTGKLYGWAGTYMIRMSILNEIYPTREIYPSKSGQNLQFVMAASYKNKAGYLDTPLMEYYVHRSSLSHFSGEQAKENELQAIKGYEDIRRYLIGYLVSPKDQGRFYSIIDRVYTDYRMSIAGKYKDKNLMKDNYRYIDRPSLEQRITYYRLICPPIGALLRYLKRMSTIGKKQVLES